MLRGVAYLALACLIALTSCQAGFAAQPSGVVAASSR